MKSNRENIPTKESRKNAAWNRQIEESGIWDWVELTQPLHGFGWLSFEALTSWLTFTGLFAIAFAATVA